MTQPHERAIAHVAVLADGGPADPAWRVTLHFHPDRLAGGVPILRRMAADGEALVLDPCYRGTDVEADARLLGRPVEWHGGFRVTTGDLRRHAGYRAPEFAELGVSLARGGCLDPAIIGDAARTGRYDEQSLKRVWHYVARFGSDEMRAGHPEAAAGKLSARHRLPVGPAHPMC
jgi:Protein of unknown function (DUF3626)